MKQVRRSAVPSEPVGPFDGGRLRHGLILYLLLFVVVLANEARANNCQVSLSQPRVDYGLVRQAERGDPQIALGKRTLRLSMACEVPVSMALRFTGVPAGLEGFRFGRQGHFTLSLQSAQVDGKSVELVMPHLSEEPATGRLLPGHRLVAHVADMPVHGRRFTALVNVETFLPAALLAVRDETTFEGQGGFEWAPGA
ncbi:MULTISPECIES: hypothetical protein [unclassified Pseudomonas]|uniref:hypothetical protein n=1 Tax=unclassified Pseudomonas TaxID=196821 RepID=UPI0015A42097|nr:MULTISPECIES: hypothetical protein [unclassified Pseudomonas]NWB61507.1 hypothetical protein [Pseudomonas sp. F1002]NWC04129.1 hypothetical protein [Pseudomonas sp. G1002]